MVLAVLLAALVEGSSIVPAPPPPPVRVEDRVHDLGPFPLPGHRFTVTLHERQIAGSPPSDTEFGTTLVGLEIEDETGAVHHRQSFEYEMSDGAFAETLRVSAELLRGRERSGLLLTYARLPSTPLGGVAWQLFGSRDDRLVPLGPPIHVEGRLVGQGEGGVLETADEPGLEAEVIRFRVWTGNVFVLYPVRVDFRMARVTPAWRCSGTSAGSDAASCRYPVEADRLPQHAEMTFVRLFPSPGEGCGVAEHVVVKKDSVVEILAAAGEVRWDEDRDGVGLEPGDDFWIEVRIDGRQGWIHTQEDLLAIGLPQAG